MIDYVAMLWKVPSVQFSCARTKEPESYTIRATSKEGVTSLILSPEQFAELAAQMAKARP